MKTFDKWILEVLYLLIPGSFYVTSIIVIIYTIVADNTISITFEIKNYLLGLIILVLLISYIIGFSINLLVQMTIWCLRPKYKLNFINSIEEPNFNSEKKDAYYLSLVMVRHLFLAMTFLWIVLIAYCTKFKQFQLEFILALTCILFSIIFLLNYFHLSMKHNLIQNNDYKEKLSISFRIIIKKHNGTARGIRHGRGFSGLTSQSFRPLF